MELLLQLERLMSRVRLPGALLFTAFAACNSVFSYGCRPSRTCPLPVPRPVTFHKPTCARPNADKLNTHSHWWALNYVNTARARVHATLVCNTRMKTMLIG
jgi:hypothetical protein